MELSFIKPKVNFGNDIITINYAVGMSIREDKDGSEELLYDELSMITDFKVRAEQDQLFIEIKSHKTNFSNNRYGTRSAPRRENLGMSEIDYKGFLSEFDTMNGKLARWMNSYLANRKNYLPWTADEF